MRNLYNVVVQEATEFLGYKWINTENGYVIHQPSILERLEDTFGEEVNNLKEYVTPCGKGFRLNKMRENEPHLNDKEQTRYRSGI